jgi:hypothetical protein
MWSAFTPCARGIEQALSAQEAVDLDPILSKLDYTPLRADDRRVGSVLHVEL